MRARQLVDQAHATTDSQVRADLFAEAGVLALLALTDEARRVSNSLETIEGLVSLLT